MSIDCEPMGETALLLHLGGSMDDAVNARVHVVATAIRQADLTDVTDIVPAYASVLVRHRPLASKTRADLHRKLLALGDDATAATPCAEGEDHEIPVCYDSGHGPDLASLAHMHGLTIQQVIDLHTAPTYRVAMTGFAPGFPYLLGLDERLATPRLETPRTRVPAGSIGIAGQQTGIYPSELPGGWRLIGQTPLALFRPGNAAHPCLLQPGDRVRFRAIDAMRFEALRKDSC